MRRTRVVKMIDWSHGTAEGSRRKRIDYNKKGSYKMLC